MYTTIKNIHEFKLHAQQLARKDNTSLSSAVASRSMISITFAKANGIGSGSSSGIHFSRNFLGKSFDMKRIRLKLSPSLLFGIERMFPNFSSAQFEVPSTGYCSFDSVLVLI